MALGALSLSLSLSLNKLTHCCTQTTRAFNLAAVVTDFQLSFRHTNAKLINTICRVGVIRNEIWRYLSSKSGRESRPSRLRSSKRALLYTWLWLHGNLRHRNNTYWSIYIREVRDMAWLFRRGLTEILQHRQGLELLPKTVSTTEVAWSVRAMFTNIFKNGD